MDSKKKLLKEESGYTLIEFAIIIAVLGISMVAIYGLIISGAKIQKASEETYEATLHSQSLLQSINEQIERDLTDKMVKERKGDNHTKIEIKPWLDPDPDIKVSTSLVEFLYGDEDGLTDEEKEKRGKEIIKFNEKFNTDNFLYEVHIWELKDGELKDDTPISFIEYRGIREAEDAQLLTPNPKDFTMVEINDAIKEYYGDKKDPLLWLSPQNPDKLDDSDIKAIGEISYDEHNGKDEKSKIKIKGNGIAGLDSIEPIEDYGDIPKVIKLTYESYIESKELTHKLVIEPNNTLQESKKLKKDDVIQLAVDLNTFPAEGSTKVIRIENKTKAKLVIPVYDENKSGIDIFPIQHRMKKDGEDDDENGRIIIQEKDRANPAKNFVIGIIVRDAYNSTFGEDSKILSKLVDVYSYDYKK